MGGSMNQLADNHPYNKRYKHCCDSQKVCGKKFDGAWFFGVASDFWNFLVVFHCWWRFSCLKQKNSAEGTVLFFSAEREGFEPPDP